MTTEEAARECIEKIGSALGFFSSVIKSGESWSETCEDEMTRVRTALANYRTAETGAGVEREPRGCPTPGACSCIDLVPDAASDIRISQVAKEARDTLASWMLSQGYTIGHGDSVEGLLGELEGQIEAKLVGKFLGYLDGQREAAARYGFEPGGLQHAWRMGQRSDERELEYAVIDALGMGGISAHPGDGVGCAAHIVIFQLRRALKAEAELTRLRELNAALTADIARKDEALKHVRDTQCAACRATDDFSIAALHPLAPGSKGDAS